MKKRIPKRKEPQKVTPKNKGGRPGPSPLPAVYETLATCAADTGIPIAILRAARRDGCEFTKGSGRVDLRAFLRWWFAKPADSEEVLQGRALYEKEHAIRERAKRLKEEGVLIDREAGVRVVTRAQSVLFATLDRVFCSEFPARCKGMDEQQIRATGRKAIEEAKADFAAGLEGELGESKRHD